MTAWGCETPPTFWKWLRLAQLFHRPWGTFSCGVGRYDSRGGETASVPCVSCRKAWIRLDRQKFSFLWSRTSTDVSGSFAWENIQAVPCQIMLETGYSASSDLSCSGERHELGLHSSLVWINSLLARPRLCPSLENAGKTEFMAALILGAFNYTYLTNLPHKKFFNRYLWVRTLFHLTSESKLFIHKDRLQGFFVWLVGWFVLFSFSVFPPWTTT